MEQQCGVASPPCYASCTEEPEDCAGAIARWTTAGGCASSCKGDDPVFVGLAEHAGCELCGEVMCKPPETCNADNSCTPCDDNEERMVAESPGDPVASCMAGAAMGMCDDNVSATFDGPPGWFGSVCCKSCNEWRHGAAKPTLQSLTTKALSDCEMEMCLNTKAAADEAYQDFNFQRFIADPTCV